MAKQKVHFSKKTNALIVVLALMIALAGAYFTGQLDALLGVTKPVGSQLEVHVIDVGNADCVLVTNQGQYLLIDAGLKTSEAKVLDYLRQHGVTRLDYVIATHADADHIGGMAAVIDAFEVGTFIMSTMPEAYTPTSATYERMIETVLAKEGLTFQEAAPGQTFPLGEAEAEILGPVGDFKDNNDQSVICRVTFGSKRFLFMGDAEKAAENALLDKWTDLRADFLKVGHHGSNTSTQGKLLDRVRPVYAVIPCGAGNSYGHPKPEVLQRLTERGIRVLRSDLDGNIIATCDGKSIEVRSEKKAG